MNLLNRQEQPLTIEPKTQNSDILNYSTIYCIISFIMHFGSASGVLSNFMFFLKPLSKLILVGMTKSSAHTETPFWLPRICHG